MAEAAEQLLETFEVTTPSGATLVAQRVGVLVEFAGAEAIGGWIYRLRDGRKLRPHPFARDLFEILESSETVRRLDLA